MKTMTFLVFANSQKIDRPGYLVAIILTPHYRGYSIYIVQNRKVLQSV